MQPDPFPLETSSSGDYLSALLPQEQQHESSSSVAGWLPPLHLSTEGSIKLERIPVKLLLVPLCNYRANSSLGAQTQPLPSEANSKCCFALEP